MACELEEKLHEETELIKSSGGIFEVQDKDTLIFSKKETNRFPETTEIFEIINQMEKGLSPSEARAVASANIPQPISFGQWLQKLLKGKAT